MGAYRRVIALWGLSLLAVAALVWGEPVVRAPPSPRPDAGAPPGQRRPLRWGPVRDEAGMLADGERARVQQELRRVAERTGVQMAVWTYAALDQQALAEAALATAERLRLGHKGRDDGLLLAVAPEAHEARIEVGYGLEHVLPDARCAQLLRQSFAGAGEDGTRGRHVVAAVVAVREVLERAAAEGQLQVPAARAVGGGTYSGDAWLWLMLALLALLALGGLGGGGPGGRASALPWLLWAGRGGARAGGGPADTQEGGGGSFGGGGASTKW